MSAVFLSLCEHFKVTLRVKRVRVTVRIMIRVTVRMPVQDKQ